MKLESISAVVSILIILYLTKAFTDELKVLTLSNPKKKKVSASQWDGYKNLQLKSSNSCNHPVSQFFKINFLKLEIETFEPSAYTNIWNTLTLIYFYSLFIISKVKCEI